MTWEEHEREFCKEIDFRPPDKDIFEECKSWSAANKSKDYYEQGYDDGNVSSLGLIKFQNSYFVVYTNSEGDEIKYRKNE